MTAVTGPALASIGLSVNRIDRRRYENSEYIVNWGTGNKTMSLPVFNADGSKAGTFCSDRWKKFPVRRWLREQGVSQCDIWLGISRDESKRVRQSDVGWAQFSHPLLGGVFGRPGSEILSRQDCLQIVAKMGWPTPPKSSCWLCPHMTDGEWRGLPADEFEAACKVDEEIRYAADKNEKYLHRSCRPLRHVNFSTNPEIAIGGCETGFCFN